MPLSAFCVFSRLSWVLRVFWYLSELVRQPGFSILAFYQYGEVTDPILILFKGLFNRL
jgi:hypothetical protein